MELSSGVILGSAGIECAALLPPLTTWRARRGRGLRLRRLDTQAGELGSRESVEEEEEEEEEGGGGPGANKDRGMEAEGGTTQEEEEEEEIAAEEVVVVVVVVVVAVVEVEGEHRLVCSGFKEEGGGLEDSTL